MDYEKKYKEALAMARDIHDGNPSSGTAITVCEQIFPELIESEDEKIRQLLIRFVKYDMGENYSDDFTPADCLAWLEKQKPVEWSHDDNWNMQIFMNALDLYKEPVDKQMLKSWFKSLRSQKRWKPTNEQLEALNEVINNYAESPVIHENSYLYNQLFNLREQLKAL